MNVVVTLAGGLLPVAIGIAVLRYRLYEIDRIVNRTLVYTTLTITLGSVYVGGAVHSSPSEDPGLRGPPVPSLPIRRRPHG